MGKLAHDIPAGNVRHSQLRPFRLANAGAGIFADGNFDPDFITSSPAGTRTDPNLPSQQLVSKLRPKSTQRLSCWHRRTYCPRAIAWETRQRKNRFADGPGNIILSCLGSSYFKKRHLIDHERRSNCLALGVRV
jgi:hypothetical protein